MLNEADIRQFPEYRSKGPAPYQGAVGHLRQSHQQQLSDSGIASVSLLTLVEERASDPCVLATLKVHDSPEEALLRATNRLENAPRLRHFDDGSRSS